MSKRKNVELPADLAGVMLCEVDDALVRMRDAAVDVLPSGRALPHKLLTCGETMRYLTTLRLLLHAKYPAFADPAILEAQIGAFAARTASPSLN